MHVGKRGAAVAVDDLVDVLAGEVRATRPRKSDQHRGGRGGLPIQRGGLRLKFRPDVTAHDGIDDVRLHAGVPGAARLGRVGVSRCRGEREVPAVAQDADGKCRHLLIVAGQHRHDFFEVLHRDPHHVDGLSQRDPPGEFLGDQGERLGGIPDVAERVAHPLGEVDQCRLHHELDTGPLRGLELGEERQAVAHDVDGLGRQPPGVLLDSAQQRFWNRLQQFERCARRRPSPPLRSPVLSATSKSYANFLAKSSKSSPAPH